MWLNGGTSAQHWWSPVLDPEPGGGDSMYQRNFRQHYVPYVHSVQLPFIKHEDCSQLGVVSISCNPSTRGWIGNTETLFQKIQDQRDGSVGKSQPPLTPLVPSLALTSYKERTDSHKLSFDLFHIHTMAHTRPCVYTQFFKIYFVNN